MAQRLIALATHGKGPDSVPRIHVEKVLQFQGTVCPPLDFVSTARMWYTCKKTCRQNSCVQI